MAVTIAVFEDHDTIRFAASELQRCLEGITGDTVQIGSAGRYDPAVHIAVGRAQSVSGLSLPEVDDPAYDDAVGIRIRNGTGIICGNNHRSVLLAVYRYLTEIGCRWVRPGPSGEIMPGPEAFRTPVDLVDTPSHRHRGICIEGAVSYENVRDTIDWLPKVGLNSYFIQFREGYTFFERWYTHPDNPIRQPEPFGVDDARRFVRGAVGEIAKRGLLYQAVGHGWTTEPFGIQGLSWDQREFDVDAAVRQYLAEIGGKRELFGGVPLNTNLCYSNAEARRTIVRDIATYALDHPSIDVLHFWLADGSNNQCECESCRTALPSDFYVQMLNELDELMTTKGLSTRVVFLIYVDLLWPPATHRIQNPDRFILMFAPITRTYREPFSTDARIPAVPEYVRNQLEFPKSVAGNLSFLQAWQELFSGDSFVYDYHFMWAHVKDPGYVRIAEVLHSDIRELETLGLGGFISCQVQRSFFPHGLGMTVLGRMLWNRETPFSSIADDYFTHSFGSDGALCADYFRTLSDLYFELDLETPDVTRLRAKGSVLTGILDHLAAFTPVIARNIHSPRRVHAASWAYLQSHARIWTDFTRVLRHVHDGDNASARAAWDRLKTSLWDNEDQYQEVFDVHNAVRVLGSICDTLLRE